MFNWLVIGWLDTSYKIKARTLKYGLTFAAWDTIIYIRLDICSMDTMHGYEGLNPSHTVYNTHFSDPKVNARDSPVEKHC